MGAFQDDVRQLQDSPPDNVIAVEATDYNLEVTLADPVETFTLVFPDDYKNTYPKGEVSAVVYSNFEDLREGTLRELIGRLNTIVQRSKGMTREPTGSSLSDDDGMYQSPSMEIDDDIHPQFLKDVQSVRDRYGPRFVTYSEQKMLDSVTVTLKLDLGYLDNSVCRAWGLAPKKSNIPLSVNLTFSRSAYTDSSKFTAECFQEGQAWCGLAGQLTRILKSFPHQSKEAAQKPENVETYSSGLIRLLEMGFPEKAAREALDSCDGDFSRASLQLIDGSKKGGQKKKTKTAAAASPQKTIEDKQAIPRRTHGLLVQVMDYAHKRIPTCSEFCVICDRPHVFSAGAMLKSSVCTREVCAFAFQQLGVGSDSASDIATDAGVVDLLVRMACHAARSPRWELIFDPYPTVFDPEDPSIKIFYPKNKDIEKVRKIMVKPSSTLTQDDDTAKMMSALDTKNKWAYPLMQWIISSNTSHLVKLRKDKGQTISSVSTPHQFLLVSAPPEKQKRFDELKRQHKSVFAFHGSSVENWHSILRNGLYNASGSKLQVNGAAHGAGIYLSPSAGVSYGYSRLEVSGGSSGNSGSSKTDTTFMSGDVTGAIAVVECVDHDIRKSGDIWVQPHSDHVVTRFLFVFDSENNPDKLLNTEDKTFNKQLREAVAQFQN